MLLIAHRGASGHAPENTMAAFRAALGMGAAAIELDVHQTTDGRLVVLHDWDLRRTGRRRLKVKRASYADLAAVDVGAWFSPKFRGERIPALEEVVDLVAGRAELHVELKKGSRLYPGIEGRVVDLIRARGALGWTVVSSFDHRALFAVRALDASVRLGYLLGFTTMRTALRETAELGAESLNVSLRQANRKRLLLAKRAGLKFLVYTVNKPKPFERLRAMGVHGVFSNYPELSGTVQNR